MKYNSDKLFMQLIEKSKSYNEDNNESMSAECFLLAVIEHLKGTYQKGNLSFEGNNLFALLKDAGLYDADNGFKRLEECLHNKINLDSIDGIDSSEYFEKILSNVIEALSYNKIHIALTSGIVKMMLAFKNDFLKEITGDYESPDIPDNAWDECFQESVENVIADLLRMKAELKEMRAVLKEIGENASNDDFEQDSSESDESNQESDEYDEEFEDDTEFDYDTIDEEDDDTESIFDYFKTSVLDMSEEEYKNASKEYDDLIVS